MAQYNGKRLAQVMRIWLAVVHYFHPVSHPASQPPCIFPFSIPCQGKSSQSKPSLAPCVFPKPLNPRLPLPRITPSPEFPSLVGQAFDVLLCSREQSFPRASNENRQVQRISWIEYMLYDNTSQPYQAPLPSCPNSGPPIVWCRSSFSSSPMWSTGSL